MNALNNRNDGPASGFSPSDQELFDYLLGSLSSEQIRQIENWLTTDKQAGERLEDLSALLLDLNQALHSIAGPVVPLVKTASKPARWLHYQRLVAGLAVAATVGFVAFSLAGFWRDNTETQVAMAWADALSSLPNADMELNPLPISDLDDNTGAAIGYEAINEIALLDEEWEPTSDMDFMSDEPPDWLLAAVSEMHDSRSVDVSFEVRP